MVCEFLLDVTKQDGSEYEPTSLKAFLSSIDRHLRPIHYNHPLINDLRALLQSLWLMCKTYFGMRAGKKNHTLGLGDVSLGVTFETSKECVITF